MNTPHGKGPARTLTVLNGADLSFLSSQLTVALYMYLGSGTVSLDTLSLAGIVVIKVSLLIEQLLYRM